MERETVHVLPEQYSQMPNLTEVYEQDVPRVENTIWRAKSLQNPAPLLNFTIQPFSTHYTLTTNDFEKSLELDVERMYRHLIRKKAEEPNYIASCRVNPKTGQFVMTVPMKGIEQLREPSERNSVNVLREEPAKDDASLKEVAPEDLPAVKNAIFRIKTLQTPMPAFRFDIVPKDGYYNVLVRELNEFLDVERMFLHLIRTPSEELNYISKVHVNFRSHTLVVAVQKTNIKEKRLGAQASLKPKRRRRSKRLQNPYDRY